MIFNSLAFAIFLPIVFIVYWGFQKSRLCIQNAVVLLVSYFFYGWWDYRFLVLLAFTSCADFSIGLLLHRTESPTRRRYFLWLSIALNLSILGFFKYFNFFVESFAIFLDVLGLSANINSLRIILPVGISFYTFQSMSYTIDIYRRRITPVSDPIQFFAFVSFFPQLLAGPIERAAKLLPQFGKKRSFSWEEAGDGMRLFLWGLLKKMVVADNVAPHVDLIFTHYQELDGVRLLIGLFLFAIQIYCDFSGYSDIAIGTARIFGIHLSRNFAYPYFSSNITEFWRRWHISLSTWFRDYVYIPLGGSFVGHGRKAANVLITFLLSGLWHGANWTFITWGILNALYYLPFAWGKRKAVKPSIGLLPSPREALSIICTFFLVIIAWTFFRAPTVSDAGLYLIRIITHPWIPTQSGYFKTAVLSGLGLLIVEWINRHREYPLDVPHWPIPMRWGLYYSLVCLLLWRGNLGYAPFIYFQF